MVLPHRYAIYFCPKPDSALGRFGSDWLSDDEYFSITEAPRRYGFHGTLKPPFRLAPRTSHDQLLVAVSALALSMKPFTIDGFDIKTIGSFLALVARSVPSQLPDLANRCVRELDTFRAPPDREELARRRKTSLTPAQDQLLMKWGYPYVMEEFRFHLTLTDQLNGSTHEELLPILTDRASDALGPFHINDICVAIEPTPGAPFELLRRFTLGNRNSIDEVGNAVSQ